MDDVEEVSVPLRTLLQRARLSPERLARQLNRKAAEMGLPNRVDEKTPYKWFKGTVPRFPWPTMVASLLSTLLRAEVTIDDLGWNIGKEDVLCVPASSGLLVPWTAEGALSAANNVMYNGIMERRFFLSLSGTALTSPALEWLIAPAAGDVKGLAGGYRVNDAYVDGIERITAQFRRMDDQFGGGAILRHVTPQVRSVIDVLRNSNYTSSVGKRLYTAAAELLRLAGFASFDAGQQPQAQRYWLAGLRAAHAGGDKAIGANILAFMSLQAKDLGLYDEAIKLSEAARRGYPGGSPRVTAILDLRAAEAHAQVKDVRACRTAIDSAHEMFGQASADTGPDWAYWLDESHVNEFTGSVYLKLGDLKRAESHLRTAIRLPSSEKREGTLRQAKLAIIHASQGEPERACQTAATAVDVLAEDVNSQRCVGHIRKVQDALRPYRRVPAVTDFNDRVGKLLAVSATGSRA